MEVEINIEESRAILSALKFLVFSTSFLRSSIVSYSYSRLSPTGFILCAEVDSSKRYGVPIFGPWITGSLLHREEIRSTDHSAAPLPPPSFFLSLSVSLCTDRSRYRREEERAQSFFSRWPLSRFRSSAGIRNSSSSSPSIRDPSDPIAANCDLFLGEVSPSSFLPVEEEDEMDEINARNADTSSFE